MFGIKMAEATRPIPKPRSRAVSSFSGPVYSSVETLDSELVCPVCQDIINHPMLLSCCGACLCNSCVNKIRESRLETRNQCPYCKQAFEAMEHKGIQRRVNAVKMYCPNRALGCRWIGEFLRIDNHIDQNDSRLEGNCQFQFVSCTHNGCTSVVPRSSRLHHESQECSYRQFICPYCHKYTSIFLTVNAEHFPNCPKFPITCPNKCNSENLPRDELKAHLTNSCPLQDTQCEYSPVGCFTVRKRENMIKHYTNNEHYHNTLLLKEFIKFKDAAESKIQKLQQECEDLRTKNKELNVELTVFKVDSSAINEEIQDELKSIKNKSIANKERVDKQELAMASLTERVNGVEKIKADVGTEVESAIEPEFKNSVQLVQEELLGIHEKVKLQNNQTSSLQETVNQIRTDIEYIENWISPSPPFAFTLGRFASHKQNKTAFSSPPFYTRVRGYKMCVRVDTDSVEGAYVGVYCCLMKGEHDNYLKWPFQGVVHIRLQNHLGDHNHFSQVIRYDKTTGDNKSGRVKTGDRNYLHGYPKYIAQNELGFDVRQNRQFLKGDALDFEVTRIQEFV